MKGSEGNRWKGVEAMARSKRERRRALAKLPFEEKIRILVMMQAMAKGAARIGSERQRVVWSI